MLKHRKLLISALLVAGAAATAGYLISYRAGPPAAVRLLPEADLLFYADLRPVHLLGLQLSKPVQVERNYQQFIEETGIQFERDLDEVAMSRRNTGDGRDPDSTEVFVGRFEGSRLGGYLRKNSSQSEDYRGRTIYSIPNQGRTVRVCVLDGSTIAVTNMASPEPMHGMIDRRGRSTVGPPLLGDYYRNVPLGSMAWLIDRAPQLPGGWNLSLLDNTVAVVSVRYNGAVLFRADVFAQSEADARRLAGSINQFLLVYGSASQSLGAKGNDPDVKAALDSIQVEQKGSSAILTATFSDRFLKKVVADVLVDVPAPDAPSGTKR
jgi:hypothetical protein